ncbi:MAG TPA: ATP-binding protein [Candidatus Paceibacterota bacterium]|nr:ATP-binding protein [Candidatus Paceibacterota bacterium]
MLINSPTDYGAGYQGTFENMLRANAAAGILTVDPQGNIGTLNAEAARILNLPPLNAPFIITHLPAPLQNVIRHVQRTGEATMNRQILTAAGPDAEPVALIVNATRSTIDNASVIAVVKVDSWTEEIEHNLRRLDRLASVGMIAASMAHEIKNALVAVRTFTELLLEKNPDAELAGIVRREISRIDSIVSQMLRFSAPAQPTFSTVQLHKLLDHSLRLVQQGSNNKRISFQSDFKAAVDVLSGDDHQLEQAFVNVLFNAVDAMPDEGSITVATDMVPDGSRDQLREGEAPQFVRIKISDTGIGIEADAIGHIFEPFFTTKRTGTGLGLAVTSRIIKEHHGTIEVESSRGKGTTFIIVLPAGAQPYHP